MNPEDKAKQIESDLKMADKMRKDAEENDRMEKENMEKEKAKADADGDKIDKVLACLDALGTRMDAFEMDSKKRKDAEGEIEEKGDPKEMSVDSRADSAEVLSELAEIQTYADRASSCWSKSAPHPWSGEMPEAYTRRVARDHQKHSENWKAVDLAELKGQALKNASEQIFADSITASKSNIEIGEMNLREVRRRDPDTGHMIKEYYGDPMAWMAQFTGGRRLARFNLNRNRGE